MPPSRFLRTGRAATLARGPAGEEGLENAGDLRLDVIAAVVGQEGDGEVARPDAVRAQGRLEGALQERLGVVVVSRPARGRAGRDEREDQERVGKASEGPHRPAPYPRRPHPREGKEG